MTPDTCQFVVLSGEKKKERYIKTVLPASWLSTCLPVLFAVCFMGQLAGEIRSGPACWQACPSVTSFIYFNF